MGALGTFLGKGLVMELARGLGIEAEVDLVWSPPWNQGMISEAGRMKLGLV